MMTLQMRGSKGVFGEPRTRARLTPLYGMALFAGLCVVPSATWAQVTTSDAQVEAAVLKALAGAPELATQAIQTRTVYGTVTLSGSVGNETLRQRAETLAANADGVKKVVDELAIGQAPANPSSPSSNDQAGKLVLQSDGTYAPANTTSGQQTSTGLSAQQPQHNNPDVDQALDRQIEQVANGNPHGADTNGREGGNSEPSQPNTGYPGAPEYPRSPTVPSFPGDPNYGRRPINPAYGQYAPGPYGPYAGQVGGQAVTVPAGVQLQVRIRQRLSTNFTQAGQIFDGVVTNDILAGNTVAIPRGAAVQGRVVEVEKSGVLKGRGAMSLQLTQVTLGGQTYPIVSDTWSHHGGDKAVQTVNSTAIGGGVGALLGAVAGGGVGAAIGAGVGGAVGLGSSAASGNGQVYIPAEALLAFHLTQPANVTSVGQGEMQRLAFGVPTGAPPQVYTRRRVYPYPGVYYGPGYYRPYGPYGPYTYPY